MRIGQDNIAIISRPRTESDARLENELRNIDCYHRSSQPPRAYELKMKNECVRPRSVLCVIE